MKAFLGKMRDTVRGWLGKIRDWLWPANSPNRGWKILAATMGGAAIVAALCMVAWAMAPTMVDILQPDGTATSQKLRSLFWTALANRPPWQMASVFASLAVAPAFILTWYWRTLARDEEIRISEASQVTNRFIAAVTLLSEDGKEAAQIGGIYALQRIALDSPRDLETVTDTLAAFVDEFGEDPGYVPRPKQAALDVLGRIGVLNVKQRGKRLAGARLQYADLIGADLTGADLTEADLTGANLTRAKLAGAKLTGANLTGAKLTWADLTGASLTGANLTGANLTGADLAGAILTGADLAGADLVWADLAGANLVWANLSNTRNLTQSQVDQTNGDSKTLLPEGIERPDHWVDVDTAPDEGSG